MKKIVLLSCCMILQGCLSTSNLVVPIPPGYDNVDYRKSVEVRLVNCIEKKVYVRLYDSNSYNYSYRTVKDTKTISIVEVVSTGQRFEIEGCYGNPGDKFRINY